MTTPADLIKPITQTEIDHLIDWLTEKSRLYYAEHYPRVPCPAFKAEWGSKNVRIVRLDRPDSDHGSAYCFVEIETGKIMKPGGYKAPEPKRYARGNANIPATWTDWLGVHGVQTFR